MNANFPIAVQQLSTFSQKRLSQNIDLNLKMYVNMVKYDLQYLGNATAWFQKSVRSCTVHTVCVCHSFCRAPQQCGGYIFLRYIITVAITNSEHYDILNGQRANKASRSKLTEQEMWAGLRAMTWLHGLQWPSPSPTNTRHFSHNPLQYTQPTHVHTCMQWCFSAHPVINHM